MPNFARRLQRCGEAMRAQAMQLAACNGHHGLDARLARCILTLQDRHRTHELPVTHELIVADRARLERASCECYRVIHDHMQLVLGQD